MGRAKPFFSRVFGSMSDHGYCAFCKAERKYLNKKHLSFLDILMTLFGSMVFGSLLWRPFDPRTLVLFSLFIGAGEVFVYLRWRVGVVCRYCGFDPVLYKTSPSRARDKVKEFYETQMNNPKFMFSRSPLLDIRRARLEQERIFAREWMLIGFAALALGFGLDYIVPLLPSFLQRYPDVVPDWSFENRPVDLIAEGFDAAIGGGAARFVHCISVLSAAVTTT